MIFKFTRPFEKSFKKITLIQILNLGKLYIVSKLKKLGI